jgi:outer membrane protein assembly factor BamB
MRIAIAFALLGSALAAIPAIAADAAKNNSLASAGPSWPQWRGPNRDGISSETGLLRSWPEEGPKLVWQVEGMGKGMSSVAVANGKIYTLGQIKGDTNLVAVDQATGKQLWTLPVGPGQPNCTPTIDGELAFALGREGDLVCCNAETGKEIWRKNFGKDFGGKMMSGWGYSESPLVDGDRLICTPGAPDAEIMALNKRTGDVIWKSAAPSDWGGTRGKEGAAYSSIVVSNGAGVKQYVQLTGRGIVSVAADDGRVLWTYNKVANGTANIPTPIVIDDYIFCSSGYGTGAALLQLSKEGSGVVADEKYFLKADEMQNHHGGMVRVGDYIYCGHGHNNGFPWCVEWKTGKRMWPQTRGAGEGSAAVLYADGLLFFRYENGEMALIEADPKEYKLVSHFKLASVKGRSWPHPVIVDGKLYIRDQDSLLCYDVRSKS